MAQAIYVDLDLNGNEIKNVKAEQLAADPSGAGLYAGRFWDNTTTGKRKYYDGAAIQIIATEGYVTTTVNQLGQMQGSFSASAGLLPTAAAKTQGDLTTIKKGDNWVITVAGTIAGIQGSSVLSVGDIVQYFGSNPATASDWVGIERNLNDALVGNVASEKQTVSLVAATPLAVNAATVVNIHSIQVYDSAGNLIIVDVQKLGGNNQRTLTSKKSLASIVVEITGSL